ncbi:conserved hypothetical protein [Brucella pinnipedialis M163/99/10]|nr:conserved hypothetical protein [Brucella pinnipedialis M163/99/10]
MFSPSLSKGIWMTHRWKTSTDCWMRPMKPTRKLTFSSVSPYEGVDWVSAFSESMLSIRSKSLKHLRRYAIIGGPLWIQASITLVQPFLSIEVRAFDPDEEQDAWEWLDAKPVEE